MYYRNSLPYQFPNAAYTGAGFPGAGAAFPGMAPLAGGMAGAPVMLPGPMPGTVGGLAGTAPVMLPGAMPGAVGGVSATMPPQIPSGVQLAPGGTAVLPSAQEESYVENILRMNLGKVATIFMTFENNCEWNAKVFKGVLEAAGRDHIIISDPTTGKRYLLLTVNLDYITFDQPLTYTLPFGSRGEESNPDD